MINRIKKYLLIMFLTLILTLSLIIIYFSLYYQRFDEFFVPVFSITLTWFFARIIVATSVYINNIQRNYEIKNTHYHNFLNALKSVTLWHNEVGTLIDTKDYSENKIIDDETKIRLKQKLKELKEYTLNDISWYHQFAIVSIKSYFPEINDLKVIIKQSLDNYFSNTNQDTFEVVRNWNKILWRILTVRQRYEKNKYEWKDYDYKKWVEDMLNHENKIEGRKNLEYNKIKRRTSFKKEILE